MLPRFACTRVANRKATAFQGETATSGGFMDGALGAQEIPLEAGDALM